MPIISSIVLSSTPQANGKLLVHEQHTDHAGMVYDHVYHADAGDDIALIAQLRGENMGADIDRIEAAKAASTNYEIPLTDIEIMRRLTPGEWAAFQVSTDETIGYFRSIFAKAKIIYRTDPLTIAGFNAMVAAGILTTDRTAEVLA